jgi:hypothetical protein
VELDAIEQNTAHQEQEYIQVLQAEPEPTLPSTESEPINTVNPIFIAPEEPLILFDRTHKVEEALQEVNVSPTETVFHFQEAPTDISESERSIDHENEMLFQINPTESILLSESSSEVQAQQDEPQTRSALFQDPLTIEEEQEDLPVQNRLEMSIEEPLTSETESESEEEYVPEKTLEIPGPIVSTTTSKSEPDSGLSVWTIWRWFEL